MILQILFTKRFSVLLTGFLSFFVTNMGASVNVDIFSSVCYLPSSQGEV